MPPRGFSPRRYLTWLAGMIVGLFALDWALLHLARAVPGIAQDVGTWGTYGDWASAVLPTMAITVTVAMWASDRSLGYRKDTADELALATLDVGTGHPRYLHNGSARDIWVVAVNGTALSLLAQPGSAHCLSGLDPYSSDGHVDVVLVGGDRWRLRSTSPPQFLPG